MQPWRLATSVASFLWGRPRVCPAIVAQFSVTGCRFTRACDLNLRHHCHPEKINLGNPAPSPPPLHDLNRSILHSPTWPRTSSAFCHPSPPSISRISLPPPKPVRLSVCLVCLSPARPIPTTSDLHHNQLPSSSPSPLPPQQRYAPVITTLPALPTCRVLPTRTTHALQHTAHHNHPRPCSHDPSPNPNPCSVPSLARSLALLPRPVICTAASERHCSPSRTQRFAI